MALPTYLELVNEILVRLREPEVTTVQENVLSKLIGKLVNDSKRQVEDAYNWNALTATMTAVTEANTFNYGLTGVGQRFKIIDAYNYTAKWRLRPASTIDMNMLFLEGGTEPRTGSPQYFNFNGLTANGDTQVDVFPVPIGAETLFFNLYVPQEKLVHDTDGLYVPSEPVILGAYARALVERGEDGGLNSSEAYGLYRSSLADHIANEASRYVEEEAWEAV
jgi:hypothetical protein